MLKSANKKELLLQTIIDKEKTLLAGRWKPHFSVAWPL